MNIHELDAASNNSVDDIRALVDQVRFAPQAGKYKVYIVDEVHMLSAGAFNAFLKTLEEPPSYAIFILATTEKHKILPTILSRCQLFDFKRITNADTVEHLQEICEKEHINAQKAALHLIAQKSEGCMRDSLSILDKIVSFTNGELTYGNTLEHLNILDEDYYFRLLDCLRQQRVADALLMYDEINRKGFEGDTVLNGMAEFFRNVLVSADTKAAVLLEVADDFKSKYQQTAKEVPASFLISALNLLNEAEMGFKQARNKRLHVELTLIRLGYLQQAIELSAENSGLSKKKPSDSRVLQFKRIAITPIPGDTPAAVPVQQPAALGTAKLIIEQPAVLPTTPKPQPAAAQTEEPVAKPTMTSLGRLKQQIAAQSQQGKNVSKPITEEELHAAWGAFVEQLRSRNNHSAVTNFKLAELQVVDNDNINIITGGEIHKAFIEVERAELILHLQQHFNNRNLTYQVLVVETEEQEKPAEQTLSRKQQYLKIIEEYPLVKELKDRLKLELE